jgi:hypothetical protein
MFAPVRIAAKLFLLLQIPFAFACSGAGPGGPDSAADAHFSGQLTVSEGGGSGRAFEAAAALSDAQIALVSGGRTVASVRTGAAGAFSLSLPAGAYTVRIPVSDGPPLEFSLTLPAGAALFAQGRVDRTAAGEYTLNVQVFRDGNADARPDDSFRVQILDRVQGDEESGVEDVVASQEEAEAAVTLCHVPPGNPDAAHTIDVGAPAASTHLAHGDTEGACAGDEAPEEQPEGEDSEEGEDDGQVKVLVCHVPPGNPENPVTIEVAEPAVPAHLAHGDTEGACAGDEAPEEEPESEEQEDEDDGQVKVLVCHVPPGNPVNPVTIEVAEAAVSAHLAHGDTEGACAGDEAPEGTEESEESGESEGTGEPDPEG